MCFTFGKLLLENGLVTVENVRSRQVSAKVRLESGFPKNLFENSSFEFRFLLPLLPAIHHRVVVSFASFESQFRIFPDRVRIRIGSFRDVFDVIIACKEIANKKLRTFLILILALIILTKSPKLLYFQLTCKSDKRLT